MRSRSCWLVGLLLLASCSAAKPPAPPPRVSDEQIVVCGQRFDVGRRVVLWTDPDGFDGYTDPPHFNDRVTRDDQPLGYDWSLDRLRRIVDQVMVHYDSAGTSKRCFEVLQKRGLSVHFMIDTDGTIYQTLDLKERAWHAGVANSRSVGIEIAHEGATDKPFPGAVRGEIQYKTLYQKPFTDAQYDALADLVAALRRVFPNVALDYPKEAGVLSPERFASFHGVLGHYHVSLEKVDPGPAFDWRRLMRDVARREATSIIVTR